MKSNVKKIFIILMFFIFIFSFFVNIAYGYNWDFEQFDDKVPAGDTSIGMVQNAGTTIIALFQIIATGIAVIMLVITGITYVLAATSDKKAELKKHLPNYMVGVAITFSAVVILQIVRDFINSNVNP